jgi:hypothetical protein
MEGMLANPDYSEAVARCWPILDEILNEQQRIMAAKDDLDPKELKGFTVAFRTLEKFKESGEESMKTNKKS